MNHDSLPLLIGAALVLGAVVKSFEASKYQKTLIGITCAGVFAIGFGIAVAVVLDVASVVPPTKTVFVNNIIAVLLIAMGVSLSALFTCFGALLWEGIRNGMRSS